MSLASVRKAIEAINTHISRPSASFPAEWEGKSSVSKHEVTAKLAEQTGLQAVDISGILKKAHISTTHVEDHSSRNSNVLFNTLSIKNVQLWRIILAFFITYIALKMRCS